MTAHAKNWGERFYDHYAHHLGQPIARTVFEPHSHGPTIQVLSFDGVFPKCRVYATLGLTHYVAEIGTVAEAILCADPSDDRLPYILASSLFYITQTRMQFGWGVVIGGIEVIAPEFARETGKSALYFSLPSIFPPPVRRISTPNGQGELYLATPISPAERQLFTAKGAQKLEQTLEDSGLDPFVLTRPSAV